MSYLDVYNQIKSIESVFKPPIDYVTIDVGTFDAATGAFSGLATTTETDPEPLEHGPNQKPVNPKPHFSGQSWLSVTIDSRWRQTVTRVPAPTVGLAPVLLKFSIKNHGGAGWSLQVAGKPVTVPAGQSSTTVNIWDLAIVSWSINFGGKSHADQIMIQRSASKLVGAGAFTIPALPLAIVYAPPADAATQSKASYGVAQSVGTTSSFQFSSDTSTSHPALPQLLDGLKGMQDGLKTLSDALSFSPDADLKALGKVLGAIGSGIGTISGTDTTGTVSVDGGSITLTQTNSQTILAETKNGGPGAGDTIHYLRDAKFAWLVAEGRLKIALLGGISSSFPASYLKAHAADPNATNLPPDVVQQLLSMDPFVTGGGMVALPADRFEDIDAQVQGPFEYGGGQTLSGAYSQTFTTTETHSHNNYTTHSHGLPAGMACETIRRGCRRAQDHRVDDPGSRKHPFGHAVDQLGTAFRNERALRRRNMARPHLWNLRIPVGTRQRHGAIPGSGQRRRWQTVAESNREAHCPGKDLFHEDGSEWPFRFLRAQHPGRQRIAASREPGRANRFD
jgi:hypothetical protein